MQKSSKATFAALSFFSLSLVGATGGSAEVTEAQLPRAASPAIFAEHALAQQGLSVGAMVSSVLVQNGLLTGVQADAGHCFKSSTKGGGSLKTLSFSTGGSQKAAIEIYYDSACKDRYVHADVTLRVLSPSQLKFDENTKLYSPTNAAQASLTLTTDAVQVANTVELATIGTAKPNGAAAADMAYGCVLLIPRSRRADVASALADNLGAVPTDAGPSVTVPCDIGVAQTSGALGGDIASRASLNVTIAGNGNVTLSGGRGQLARGAKDMLGIEAPTRTTVAITGPQTAVGNTSISGALATFGIFPRGPSSWQVTNAAQKMTFSIAVPDGGSNFTGTIKKGPTTLARFSVDLYGKGSITYSNGQKANIMAWLLQN